MKVSSYNNTPQMEEEIIFVQKEYITKYNSDSIKIMIGKTKDNIFFRSTYYELKINKDDLSILTKTLYKSIDESFEFIENIFNQQKYKIKEKTSNKIKLILRIYDMIKGKEKDIEFILLENFENQSNLIKDLFDKYINIEKEIYEIKNDNKKLNEENNKIKKDNNFLKMENEMIKNIHKNDNGGLLMKYMNMTNTMNIIQQQINQLMNQINEIKQKINNMPINNFNLMNQNDFNVMNNINNLNNNFNGMNRNNLNFMNNINNGGNLMNLNNINSKNNLLNISSNNNTKFIIFRFSYWRKNYNIEFKDEDKISTLINKFRQKANYFNDDIQFIWNAKILSGNLTATQIGLFENGNIFVVRSSYIIIKISGMNDVLPFIIRFSLLKKVSEIIDCFISISGLTRSEISKCVFNSKKLNENITIEEAGLKHRSEIIIYIKYPLNYKYIRFQSINNDNMNNNQYIQIECLRTEIISSLLDRYRYKTDNFNKQITFTYNSKELDFDKNIEDFGLKHQSIIIANFQFPTTEGASFGIEGGENVGTVGYGTSVIGTAEGATYGAEGDAFGAAGASFGIEGGENAFTAEGATYGAEGAASFGTISTGGEAFQTTTTTNTFESSLPSVPSNQLVSTINPDFLPGPYISAVKE